MPDAAAVDPGDSSLVRTGEPDPGLPGDCSFARTLPVLTLAELFTAVKAIGGRLERRGEGVVVNAPAGTITPDIQAACKQYQADLLLLVPEQQPPPTTTAPSFSDVDAVVKAVYAQGGTIVKGDDGRCTLKLRQPDPELEAAFARMHEDICKQFLTEQQFFARLDALKPR